MLMSLELQKDFLIGGQKIHIQSCPSLQNLKESRVALPAERLAVCEGRSQAEMPDRHLAPEAST